MPGNFRSGIDYDHDRNQHSLTGAKIALDRFLSMLKATSLLDVGAGKGNWLAAALQIGVHDVLGLDGVPPENRELFVDSSLIKTVDLTQPVYLNRKFDIALCLEVAEHLDAGSAHTLVETLCTHSDQVVFSAACPGQRGQHHVNCQWPAFWQQLFNARGFACFDSLRWAIWDESRIEPWYRQNVFLARKDPNRAGSEARIPSVIHPEMVRHIDLPVHRDFIEGRLSPKLYARLALSSFSNRLIHRLTSMAQSSR